MTFGKFGRAGAIWMFLFVALVGLAAVAYGVRTGATTVMAQDVDDDALTRAYVDRAIEYYMDRGLSKTVERYGTAELGELELPHRGGRRDARPGVFTSDIPERKGC